MRSKERFGFNVKVVDTPGFFDTDISEENVVKEILKCIGMTFPGPHCFLVVLKPERFTEECAKSIKRCFDLFGENMEEFTIFVFTREQDLGGFSALDYITDTTLKQLVAKCGNRCVAIENKTTSPTTDIKPLFTMITNISKKGKNHYTNEMYTEAQKIMTKKFEHEMKETGKLKEELRRMEEALNQLKSGRKSKDGGEQQKLDGEEANQKINKLQQEICKLKELIEKRMSEHATPLSTFLVNLGNVVLTQVLTTYVKKACKFTPTIIKNIFEFLK